MMSKIPASSIRFQLALSAEKYMAYYKGTAQFIKVHSVDNRSVKFPANAIRSFLRHDGIYGMFEIQFDENNKLIKVIQIN